MKENTAVHYFLQEIKESLGISFGMSVLAGAICIILDCGTDVLFVMKPVQDLSVFSYIGTYFPSGFYGTFVFAPLMALPYGLSYYRDYNAGIIQTVAARIGVAVYCIGKVLGAFLSSFLSCVCSMTISVEILHLFLPLATDETAIGLDGSPFITLIASGNYPEYFTIFIFLMGLWCGIYGVIVLCTSVYVINAYVCIAAAVVGTYGITVLLNILNVGVACRPSSWFKCSMSPFSDKWTFLSCLFLTLASVFILMVVFRRKVNLRLRNE